jgi:hypothetical protein
VSARTKALIAHATKHGVVRMKRAQAQEFLTEHLHELDGLPVHFMEPCECGEQTRLHFRGSFESDYAERLAEKEPLLDPNHYTFELWRK